MSLRKCLRFSVVLFLLFPFLFLISQFRIDSHLDWQELWWAFKNSVIQAFFSALCSLLLGFWVSLGLLGLRQGLLKKTRPLFEVLCLLPNFLPPIFILLSTLNVIDPFPMGLVGIVIIHTFMNFGLVAVLLSEEIANKIGGLIELSYVEGARRWQVILRVLLPLLKKDLLMMGLFIFAVCFGSFAVPLVVGGGKGTTIEVLIYEKIRLSSDWGQAVLLALLQSGFIFAISFFANKGRGQQSTRNANLNLLRSFSGISILVLFSVVYFLGYIEGFFSGLTMVTTFYDVQSALFWNFWGTLGLGLATGILCFISLMVIAYGWSTGWFEKFLNGYVAPSTSLACFAFLILGPNEGFYPFIKIPLAITLLSLNSLFRMGWDGAIQALSQQRTVAYAMGASSEQIFREILFPQILDRAGLLAGIVSVWACGDFAVSRILAHRDLSIAMMTETLMSGYRLNQAIVLSGVIVFSSLICFVFFVGGSRVLRRKYKA